MKFGIQGFMAALLAVALVAPVDAQPPQGRGQRGPGGFGGGFGGGGGGLLALAQIPEVQKEIKVTDDQKGLLEEMARDLREGAPRFSREDFQNLNDEQRRARFDEMRKQAEERSKQAEEGLKAALEETQFARLKQLQVQREGVIAALSREDIAAELKLTGDQKEKIAKIREENRPQFGGGRGPGGPGGQRPNAEGGQRPDPQTTFAEIRARREKAEADAVAVLTAEQKTAFEKMQGPKFEFPAMQFGRGPGGPGGQRGEGGNRPGRPQPE